MLYLLITSCWRFKNWCWMPLFWANSISKFDHRYNKFAESLILIYLANSRSFWTRHRANPLWLVKKNFCKWNLVPNSRKIVKEGIITFVSIDRAESSLPMLEPHVHLASRLLEHFPAKLWARTWSKLHRANPRSFAICSNKSWTEYFQIKLFFLVRKKTDDRFPQFC